MPAFRPDLTPGFSTPADAAACREMIRVGSRSFHAASLLLPEEVRQAAYALYAFCRLADDAVDVDGGGLAAVSALSARLDRVYAGQPGSDPVDRALADAVRGHSIPRAPLDALLEGLAWDVEARRYETLSEVFDYAARVAGAVGAMMACLMGARGPDLVARACDLGVAMQLTNIARDVGEDAANGRLYLPRAWLREAGLDPDVWLAAPAFGPGIASVIARLLAEADLLYARADAGVERLPAAYRPAIGAAGRLYAEIGRRLRRRGLDSITSRTTVPGPRKLQLMGAAWLAAHRPPRLTVDAPPLAETRWLVEAVQAERVQTRPDAPTDDLGWVISLFAALESRRRSQARVAP